jgi:L-amino acid N-acyltransferase YncA
VSGRVRLAVEADLPAIDAIYNQAIAGRFLTADLKPIGAQRRREWFDVHDSARYPVFVYKDDGQVLGWLSLSAYRPGREALQDVAEISYYVDEAHRGEGIGTRLMEHALAESIHMKKRVLFAVIIEGNDASLALLKKFGFEQWGYLPQVIACYGEVRGQLYLGKLLINNK